MHIEFPKKHDEKAIEYYYLSVVNAMLHFCGVSRPNCSFAVGCLARHINRTGDERGLILARHVS